MTIATSAAAGSRVRWVIPELDARGEIDGHAAMCLRHAIQEARTSAFGLVLVDLRDLIAIDPAGIALFRAHDADCHAHGASLGLLMGGHQRHAALAEAFVRAGLGDMLRYADEPALPAVADRDGLRRRARAARVRLALPARFAPHRERPSRTA